MDAPKIKLEEVYRRRSTAKDRRAGFVSVLTKQVAK